MSLIAAASAFGISSPVCSTETGHGVSPLHHEQLLCIAPDDQYHALILDALWTWPPHPHLHPYSLSGIGPEDGMDPVHFGIMLLLNLSIGSALPCGSALLSEAP